MIIQIKSVNGAITNFFTEPSFTVKKLKEMIELSTTIDPAQQRFVFKGKILADSKTLGFYDITSGSMLQLIVQLYGG